MLILQRMQGYEDSRREMNGRTQTGENVGAEEWDTACVREIKLSGGL